MADDGNENVRRPDCFGGKESKITRIKRWGNMEGKRWEFRNTMAAANKKKHQDRKGRARKHGQKKNEKPLLK